MASIVTKAPSRARRSSSNGMAAISFDLPATASCPSTRRWRLAQAGTRRRGARPLPPARVRREALPSTATRSGSASRRPSTQRVKQPLNSSGSSAATTSPSVSWLGMPCRQGKKRRRKARCPPPQSAISTKSSAPASVPQSRRRMISGRGWSTLACCRESSRAEKWSSNGPLAGRSMGASGAGAPDQPELPAAANLPLVHPIALADLVGGLDLGALRAHEAEDDRLALRHEAERGEVARALVVVLEEEAVDTHVAEQDFGHGLVVLPCHELLDAGGGSKARRQQGHRGNRRISATPRSRRKVAIESGLCRSGRTGATAGALLVRPLGGLILGSRARRGKAAALGH